MIQAQVSYLIYELLVPHIPTYSKQDRRQFEYHLSVSKHDLPARSSDIHCEFMMGGQQGSQPESVCQKSPTTG